MENFYEDHPPGSRLPTQHEKLAAVLKRPAKRNGDDLMADLQELLTDNGGEFRGR